MLEDFKTVTQNKFEVGDKVYEITRPQQLMAIIRRNGILYYCHLVEDKEHVMAFMERDLKKVESSSIISQVKSRHTT